MPKYVIERDIPNVGSVTPEQVIAISQKSCSVLNNLGPKIQWLHSYVTQDKIYCVYIAPNEEMVREHLKQGGFPATRVSEVKQVIDPTSAEAQAAWRVSRTQARCGAGALAREMPEARPSLARAPVHRPPRESAP